ncbi:hypothetical protein QBC34DRAFT_493738 [Podospora aff. communis PSN243]|uniref:Uncharacterized protein n=1 Tax=Podospora aff. communis PSN243 TaxID=3040156 RepID=A0AAV9GR72_9PEZI|nr:hypothetical protein QBC34DRAFT_493738 [Podospora aff. communis PSN243]
MAFNKYRRLQAFEEFEQVIRSYDGKNGGSLNPHRLFGYFHGPIPNYNHGWWPVGVVAAIDITEEKNSEAPNTDRPASQTRSGKIQDRQEQCAESQSRRNLPSADTCDPGTPAPYVTSHERSRGVNGHGKAGAARLALVHWVVSGGWRDARYETRPDVKAEIHDVKLIADIAEHIATNDEVFAGKWGTEFNRPEHRRRPAADSAACFASSVGTQHCSIVVKQEQEPRFTLAPDSESDEESVEVNDDSDSTNDHEDDADWDAKEDVEGESEADSDEERNASRRSVSPSSSDIIVLSERPARKSHATNVPANDKGKEKAMLKQGSSRRKRADTAGRAAPGAKKARGGENDQRSRLGGNDCSSTLAAAEILRETVCPGLTVAIGLLGRVAQLDPAIGSDLRKSLDNWGNLKRHLIDVHFDLRANLGFTGIRREMERTASLNAMLRWVLCGGWRDADFKTEPDHIINHSVPEASYAERLAEAAEEIARNDPAFARKFGTEFNRRGDRTRARNRQAPAFIPNAASSAPPRYVRPRRGPSRNMDMDMDESGADSVLTSSGSELTFEGEAEGSSLPAEDRMDMPLVIKEEDSMDKPLVVKEEGSMNKPLVTKEEDSSGDEDVDRDEQLHADKDVTGSSAASKPSRLNKGKGKAGDISANEPAPRQNLRVQQLLRAAPPISRKRGAEAEVSGGSATRAKARRIEQEDSSEDADSASYDAVLATLATTAASLAATASGLIEAVAGLRRSRRRRSRRH